VALDSLSAFFSYSRADSEFALKLAEDLRAAGANVWMDQLDIEPGTPWDRAVEEALTRSPCMLVILSSVSVNSNNVSDEVSFALSKRKRIIPVLYRDCEVPFRLARLQHIDFRADYAPGLKALVKALGVEQGGMSGGASQATPSVNRKRALAAEDCAAETRMEREERERGSIAEQAALREEPGHRRIAAEQALLERKNQSVPAPLTPRYRSSFAVGIALPAILLALWALAHWGSPSLNEKGQEARRQEPVTLKQEPQPQSTNAPSSQTTSNQPPDIPPSNPLRTETSKSSTSAKSFQKPAFHPITPQYQGSTSGAASGNESAAMADLGNKVQEETFANLQIFSEPNLAGLSAKAHAGDSDAMVLIGDSYSKGEGVARNDQLAVIWYREAADLGNTDGMNRLGNMYANGIGVEQNKDQARMWFLKALAVLHERLKRAAANLKN
jgi:TIR domain/Sel1 repeat